MDAFRTAIDRRQFLTVGATIGLAATAGCTGAPDEDRPADDDRPIDDAVEDDPAVNDDPAVDDGAAFEVGIVAEGLGHPWAIAFVPDDTRMLVTEREGRLRWVDREDGQIGSIDGTPAVDARGQGGLLDVAIDPAYPEEPWLYLTYAATNDEGETATHLARGRLALDAGTLEDVETIHVAEPFVESTVHYGSRVIVEGGMLYVTVGDRGDKRFGERASEHYSQDTTTELGATLRLERDGSIPEDNPFVDDPDVADSIVSYGHRNAQGMTVHPETGEIWQSEHGEEDGDEINVIEAGGNYGWPITHYGCEYGTDEPVGPDPHERDDVIDPVYYWECTSGGFPPAGMTFYDGEAFPEWQGDLFVGTLAGQYLGRFAVDGTDVEEREQLLADRGWRIRDVAVAPDSGHLYLAIDASDAPIVRLRSE